MTSPFDLTGKAAVITGSSRGIGKAIAVSMAALGARVVISSRKADACEAAAADIRAAGGEAVVIPCNVSRKDEVEALARRLRQTPDVEMLVNNAGFGTLEHFVDIDVSRHLEMIHLHVQTPMLLTHAVLPGMIERDRARPAETPR